MERIASTLDAFDQVGITHSGTARSPAEAQPAVFTVNNIKVAHLSYTRGGNIGFPAEAWRINRAASADAITADVRAARAELVIVSVHVMPELQAAPAAADRTVVTELTANAKVDLVIMHGPHPIEPVEQVNGTLVYWSLGNLISGMGTPSPNGRFDDPRTLDGLMANVTFQQQADGSFAATPLWPISTSAVRRSREAAGSADAVVRRDQQRRAVDRIEQVKLCEVDVEAQRLPDAERQRGVERHDQ